MCIHSPGGVCVYVKDRGDGVLETRLYMRRVSVASYRTYVLVAQNTLIVVVIIIISSCSSSSSSLGVFMCWWWCRSYHASCWEHYWLHETQSRARSQYVTKLLWWCLRHVRLRGRRRNEATVMMPPPRQTAWQAQASCSQPNPFVCLFVLLPNLCVNTTFWKTMNRFWCQSAQVVPG